MNTGHSGRMAIADAFFGTTLAKPATSPRLGEVGSQLRVRLVEPALIQPFQICHR